MIGVLGSKQLERNTSPYPTLSDEKTNTKMLNKRPSIME